MNGNSQSLIVFIALSLCAKTYLKQPNTQINRESKKAMERSKHSKARSAKKLGVNKQVLAALNRISDKHKDDGVHPLDLKQRKLKKDAARKTDKAMIWAAASGHFESEILESLSFQKNINIALKCQNAEFDVATLFKQFSNFSVKLSYLDSTTDSVKSQLLTFRDVYGIRSYRKELNHCDALWKFIFYEQTHLFWSMAIYFSLLKTTFVPEWDAMFKKEFDLIAKYGKDNYIQKDVEELEKQ